MRHHSIAQALDVIVRMHTISSGLRIADLVIGWIELKADLVIMHIGRGATSEVVRRGLGGVGATSGATLGRRWGDLGGDLGRWLLAGSLPGGCRAAVGVRWGRDWGEVGAVWWGGWVDG